MPHIIRKVQEYSTSLYTNPAIAESGTNKLRVAGRIVQKSEGDLGHKRPHREYS